MAMQIKCAVQGSLTTHCWQNRVWFFSSNNALYHFPGNWFNVGHIRHLRISHDGCRIAVHQNNFVTLVTQSFTSLRTRIVKLTSLSNHNWTCTNNQNALNVATLRHYLPPLLPTAAAFMSSTKRSNK